MNARAGVDLALAVVRTVVNKAAHGRVRYQTGRGHALVNDVRVHRFLHQGLTALAGPLSPYVAVHEEFGWNYVQALAHVFADTHHGLAASAGRVLWLMVVVHPFEVLGQCLAFRLATGVGVWGATWHLEGSLQRFELGFQVCLVGRHCFLKQLALLGIHAFGLGRKLPGLQAAQLKGDAGDLGIPELDGLGLRFDFELTPESWTVNV